MTETILTLGTVWAVVSGLGVALLGLAALYGGRSRPRGAVAFALFGILWGCQIILGNLANFAPNAQTSRLMILLSFAFLAPLPVFLTGFASVQLSASRSRMWWALRAGAAASGALTALALLLAPELLLKGIGEADGQFYSVYGPLHPFLIVLPLYATFALAFFGLAHAVRHAPTPRTGTQVAFMLVGLGMFLAPTAAKLSVVYLHALLVGGGTASVLLYGVIFGSLTLLLAGYVFVSHRLSRTTPGPEAPIHRAVSAVLATALGLGLIEGAVNVFINQAFYAVGLWRLLGVGVVVYGIARWRTHDLSTRAASFASRAGGTTLAGAGAAGTFGISQAVTGSGAVSLFAGLVVLGAMLVPSVRFMRRLFGVRASAGAPGTDPSYGARIDAYRAALEASIARGTMEEDVEFLAALRERFQITEGEDRVLRHYAQTSVIVPRDRRAWEAYERLRLLGEGGAGRTWLARDRSRDRLVVLKEPLEHWQKDASVREAVLREAKLASRVRHANVVAVEEVVEGNGSPVMVMEYMDGGSLSDLLRARGTLPWRDAVPLVIEVLRGVEAVHAAGIVHRDIKPSNILLTGDGVPKVADFGIALPTSNSTRTQIDMGSAATRAGTFYYMAPEVRDGSQLGDKRSDVYACAAVLHEMLYGAPPGAHSPVVIRKDLPEPLTALLARALAPHPEERPATARAFGEDLSRLLRQ